MSAKKEVKLRSGYRKIHIDYYNKLLDGVWQWRYLGGIVSIYSPDGNKFSPHESEVAVGGWTVLPSDVKEWILKHGNEVKVPKSRKKPKTTQWSHDGWMIELKKYMDLNCETFSYKVISESGEVMEGKGFCSDFGNDDEKIIEMVKRLVEKRAIDLISDALSENL